MEVARERGRASVRERVVRLRQRGWQIGQCAVAAGLAWLLAAEVLGHPDPVFAPIAAVVSLGTSYGQRLRRVAEVTAGVAIGVLLGDLLVLQVGTGFWQIGMIVALAMVTAVLLDAGTLFVTQAAIQSIFVAALVPGSGAAFTRWTDALVGGAVALAAATLVPAAPLRRPRDAAASVLRTVSDLLRGAAEVMAEGDVEHGRALLAEARGHRLARASTPARCRRGHGGGVVVAVPGAAPAGHPADGRARGAAGPLAAQHPGARAAGGRGRLPPPSGAHDLHRPHPRPRRRRRPGGRRARSRTGWPRRHARP